jgi:hypothetical protein
VIKIEDKRHIRLISPTVPVLIAKFKMHEKGTPMGLVVNSMSAPSYNLAKCLCKLTNTAPEVQYSYNVRKPMQKLPIFSR